MATIEVQRYGRIIRTGRCFFAETIAHSRYDGDCKLSHGSVVVPLFNEEENVPILQSELRAALSGLDHEIVFVDDGSVDRTVEQIETAPNIRVIRFEKNTGQSAAIYAGLQAARGATAVLIDGDLQNDPADIPRLLAEIARGADLVCGYRVKRKDTAAEAANKPDRQRRSQPFHKRRCARHGLHAEGDAPRMRERAGSI